MTCSIYDILKASQCVYNWLSYLSKASDNGKLIAESSIKYPFVECLERHSVNDIHLEFPHPLFKGKRMDVYIGDANDDTINDCSSHMVFVEFKFVRGDTLSENRYFNDIMRLSYLKQQYPNSENYLLICGETASFNNAFKYHYNCNKNKEMQQDNSGTKRKKYKSIYNKWFYFKMGRGDKEVNIKKNHSKFVSSFKDDYMSPKKENILLEEKNTFKTQLKLILPSHNSIDNSYSLGLWEIS